MAETEFKRIVLSLHRSMPEEAAIGAAAEFAHLLCLELVGLFAEDPNLIALAGLPFGRELRLLERRWQPIDAGQLAKDMAAAAARAQRVFVEKAAAMSLAADFRSVKGSISELVESLLRAGDIIAVSLPESGADRATVQYARLLQTALRSAAGALLVPSPIARHAGAIAALAASPEDPCVRVARGIAAAAKEDFIMVTGAESIRGGRILGAVSALRGLSERLVVVSRGAIDEAQIPTIAFARRVPVLVVEATK
jgi:hypothetical protein